MTLVAAAFASRDNEYLRIMQLLTRKRARINAVMAAATAACLCALPGCSPRNDAASSTVPASAPAASALAASGATGAATPAQAASAPAIALRRSAIQIKFVQMFEKECMPRIPPNAALSPTQRLDFCQCYAAAITDNTSEMQLTRYLAGQDQAQLQGDAERHGRHCLEQAQRRP